jgi:hypothetical protein
LTILARTNSNYLFFPYPSFLFKFWHTNSITPPSYPVD